MKLGGARVAIERGYMQSEIQHAAYQYQRAVEKKEQLVVGVNAFEVDENMTLERLRFDPSIEQGQRERLAELRAKRDNQKVAELLAHLETAARGRESLMPVFIECVRSLDHLRRDLRRAARDMG